MKKIISIVIIFVFFSASKGLASDVLNRIDYVKTYNSFAIENMRMYKIPASITLAQGILESGSGNSDLARKSNNHFGIKCGSNWKGGKTYHDDDAKGECFRTYNSVLDSYNDHSKFLTGNSRYQELFLFRVDDYESWAKGLSKAGYATNPNYAHLLIKIIEDLNLNSYDGAQYPSKRRNQSISSKHSKIFEVNEVHTVTAKKGDSYYKIAKKFGLTLHQIHKYNSTKWRNDLLEEGDVVYIEPKRTRSRKNKYIILSKNSSLKEVSQQEGVKLKPLLRKNHISSPDEQLRKGKKVFLR